MRDKRAWIPMIAVEVVCNGWTPETYERKLGRDLRWVVVSPTLEHLRHSLRYRVLGEEE